MRIAPLLLLLLATGAAAESASKKDVPPPPPMPANAPAARLPAPPPENNSQQEVIEPQVTIVQRGENIVEEYRISGRLYMIKITPPKGYPYFLIDTDGDGSLETRRTELSNPPIPQWVLFRW